MRSLNTILLLARTQLKRSLRDPVTLIVLLGIPLLLLLIFGSIVSNGDNISVRVAVLNNSQEQFAEDFQKSLGEIKALKISDEKLNLEQAKDAMKNDELDGIIELPSEFGRQQQGRPEGKIQLYYDQSDAQTADIVASVMQSVVDSANSQLTNIERPITVERQAINIVEVSAFDNIYAIFTGMALMMVGIFGVASQFPADKKTGALRRLQVTPLKSRHILFGTSLAFLAVGLAITAVMTILATMLFGLDMRGNWLTYVVFVVAALIMLLGFGLAIGGVAKNSTQSDVMGQIVFLASMAASGIWFPRALMPEFLQGITGFLPLTPVIDGIRSIVTEAATLSSLLPELGVIVAWAVVVYAVGMRMFRWT